MNYIKITNILGNVINGTFVPGIVCNGSGSIGWNSPPITSGYYSYTGNTVTVSVNITASYFNSPGIGRNPWVTNLPNFGKTIVGISGECDSYASSFTGASLPYTISWDNGSGPGGYPQSQVTFYTGDTQLVFQAVPGTCNLYFTITYLLT
jgi:hypothetical protein